MQQLFYNGKDISDAVELAELEIQDSYGDQADAIDARMINSENQWSDWKPQKGDSLSVTYDGYRSGTMWIDRIRQEDGNILLGAVSLPPDAKTKRTQIWEGISFPALAAEKAARYGLSVQLYGVPGFSYSRLDQMGRGDFGFLQERAMLEGCTIKLQDNCLIVCSDPWLEAQPAAAVIEASNFIEEPYFSDSAGDTYRSCTICWQACVGSFEDSGASGPNLMISDYPVFSISEAQRFAKNILRNHNRKEIVGEIAISLNTKMTAGNNISIVGMGLNDGDYFIDTAQHSIKAQVSRFTLHRCFTRY